jgi:Uma2 family endonuclease
LRWWAKGDQTGVAFDSSTGFKLPNGALRSPHAAWVRRPRLAGLTRDQKQRFLPLCPDFVIELRSPTDNLEALQRKIQEYLDIGAQLGWLIDPMTRCVHVYLPQPPPEILEAPSTVSAEPLVPSFRLNLQTIWELNL